MKNNFGLVIKRQDGWMRVTTFKSKLEPTDDILNNIRLRQIIYSKLVEISVPSKWTHIVEIWCNRERASGKLLFRPHLPKNERWSVINSDGEIITANSKGRGSSYKRAVELWRNGKLVSEFESISACARHIKCEARRVHYAATNNSLLDKRYRVKFKGVEGKENEN